MNIVGENFPSEIVKQINVRQAKKGAKNRDNKNLVWQNSNTGWVKMVSSVNIDLKNRTKVSNKEMDDILLPGNKLAQEYVLFGGVYYQGKNKDGLSRGIARNGSVLNHAAYGLGGLDLGLRPMPGITSFSIKSENRGSLRTATIGIKCYNRHQFDIINTLYLSLGYSVLIEWGNTMYYDNNEIFEEENPHSLADQFLNPSKDFKWNNILDVIQKKRLESCGNYDASLGKVVNFSWTLNKDLSYDITVTVRSVGDVIESLKMNALSGYIPVDLSLSISQQVTTAFSESGTKDFSRFILNKAALVKQIYNRLLQNGLDDLKARGVLANMLAESTFRPEAYAKDTNGLFSGGLVQWNGPRLSAMISSVGSNWRTNWQGQVDYIFKEKGSKIQQYKNERFNTAEDAALWWAQYWEVTARKHWPQRAANVKLFPPGLNLSAANTNTNTTNTNAVVPLKNTPQKTTTNKPIATQPSPGIITNFTDIITGQSTTPTTTTTIPDTTQPVPESEEALLTGPDLVQPTEATSVEVISKYAYTHDIGALFYNIRISLDSNPTLTNGSSVDAVKISFENNGANTDEYYIRLGYFLQQIEKNIIYQLKNSDEKNPSKIIKIDYNTDSNIILLYSRQLSANPNVCIFQRSYTLDDGSEIILFPNLNKFILDGYGNSNSPFYGKIMNAYFSMKDILIQMDSLKNADTGVLTLIDLLKILTGGFCKSTGNYNKLEPTVDADTNTVKLIDSLPLPNFSQIIDKLPSNKSKIPAEFKMFGYYATPNPDVSTAGIVRDLSLTTTVSPNLATMLTIGAQSNGYVTGQDSTALSVMNYGLKDRVKEEWIEPSSKINYPSPSVFIAPLQPPQTQNQTPVSTGVPFQNTLNSTFTNFLTPLPKTTQPPPPAQPASPPGPPTLKEKYKDVIDAFNRFIQEMAANTWNQDDIIAFSNSIQSFAEYNQAEETLKQRQSDPLASSPSIGFLPFDLTLTIDGLSGMKIYQKFVADTEFLPSNYPQSLEFIIKGITHEIKDNQWITRLESLATPKAPFGSKSNLSVGAKITGKTSPIEREGTPRPDNFTPVPGNSKSVTSGIPIKSTGHQAGNFTKTQIVIHYSAGQQTATARETIDVLNNRSKGGYSYHYIIQANGFVEQMVPDNYKAYHAKGGNANSIGISLENLGWAKDANTSSYGKIPSNQTRAAQLVDFYGNPKPYRNIRWAQEITDAQYTALVNLIKKIKKNNPKITWPGLNTETFNIMFPAGTSYSASRPGLYSHCAVTTEKLDVLPTPKIVAALKAIGSL